MSNTTRYVSSPTEADYIKQNIKLLDYGKDLSKVTPKVIPPLNDGGGTTDGGPNSFKYIAGLLFSTKKLEVRNQDLPMTNEGWFNSIKNRPSLEHNVIKFNRKHNIRSFDFILSYSQLNRWAADTYKAIPITKQFKGSIIFTGCSFVFNKELGEHVPLEIHANYELIGDSLGEDDALDEFGGTKGGPRVIFTYTFDADYVYFYISGVYPLRVVPIGPGEFEDISMGDNTGSFTYEKKRTRIIEKDHIKGTVGEEDYIRDAVTYCDIAISLKDTTIDSSNEYLSFVSINDIDTSSLDKNNKYFTLYPNRFGAIKTLGMTIASDVNTEVTSDIHPLRFGTRAIDTDKAQIEAIAEKIETRIKDAAIAVEKVPFIIKENIRFHGLYNIIDDYFIDNNADSFGRFYIEEVGYYDAILDNFNITNYFFDFEKNGDLKTVADIRNFINNCSPEFSKHVGSEVKSSMKTSSPLMLMKSFEFVPDADYKKYSEITYVKSKSGPVKKVFIELAKSNTPNDYDKLVYFSFNDAELDKPNNPYNDIIIPYVTICDFKDYDMQYTIRKNIFPESTPFNVRHITSVASYYDASSPYSNIYLIGTSDGVFYELYLDSSFNPIISEDYHNPFLHNEGESTSDSIVDNEALVDIKVNDGYIYFIGKSKFALYDISSKGYIPIDQKRYKAALKGYTLKYVKPLDDTTFLFVTDGGVVTYNTVSRIFTSNDINYKYNIDYKDNRASDYGNTNYNFQVDDVTNASFIQVGQAEYIIGSRTTDSSVSQKLNIATGEIQDITSDIYQYIKPGICSNGRAIFSIGGKTNEELSLTRFNSEDTPFRVYNILTGSWSNEELLLLEVTDPLGAGKYGRLDNGLPVIAQHDNVIYLFRPQIAAIEGTINEKYYNNKGIKITLNDDYSIDNLETFDITIPPEQENADALPLDLEVTWLPVYWNKEECEFIALYKIEESTTYYRFVQFKISYEDFTLTILKAADITDEKFLDYDEDLLPLDALEHAKFYSDDGKVLIFCRDKFLIYTDGEGEITIYGLDNGSVLLPTSIYDMYWKKSIGNKTHLNTYLIHRDEYLVFAGGEGYRNADYFDLNTFSFLETPRYGSLENTILEASKELLRVPSDRLALGSMSSYNFNNSIYIVASIVTNSLALNNYTELLDREEAPSLLLLFKIDVTRRDLEITLVKDLTDAVSKKGLIDGYKFINLYSVGKYLFISFGHHSYFDNTHQTFTHENINRWGNVIVYNEKDDTLIDFSSDENIEGIGLFPLIFTYGKDYTIICKDRFISEIYPYSGTRDPYIVGIQKDFGNHTGYWDVNGNKLSLASESELSFKYASGVSYGHFGFIVTPISIEIVDLDLLVKSYEDVNDRLVTSKVVYRFSRRDIALFKDVFIDGNYLYVTGGLRTSSLQNDSANGVNNRVLRFYIPKIIELYNAASLEGNDMSTVYKEVPEVIQLASPTIKYFSSYGITPRHDFITVGDIHFVYENNPSYSTEKEPFDAIISPKGYVYKDIEKSVVKKNRIYDIEKLPESSVNIFNASYYAFNYKNRDFILVYGGSQTPTSPVTTNVDLYDVNHHRWIDAPPLPFLIKDISFMDNKILGATKIKEDLSEEPYNTVLSLVSNDEETLWTWEVEEYSNDDNISKPYNCYARIHDENTGVTKSLIVSKKKDGVFYSDSFPQSILVNTKDDTDDTWETLSPIPISSFFKYKLIGCDIIRDNGSEYFWIFLYRTDDKTFQLWSYNGGVWISLFTDITCSGLLDGSDDFYLTQSSPNELWFKFQKEPGGDILLGRIRWNFDNGEITHLGIETCGNFGNDIDIRYSVSSGDLYTKDSFGRFHHILKDDLIFGIYNSIALGFKLNVLQNESVTTSFSSKIKTKNRTGSVLRDAIDIKELSISNGNGGLIVTVFTLDKESQNKKMFYCVIYDTVNDRQSGIFPILGDTQFENNIDIGFEVIASPEPIINHFHNNNGESSFLLIAHIENQLILHDVSFNREAIFTDEGRVEIKALFYIENQGTSIDSLSVSRHCFDYTANAFLQLASYGQEPTHLYKADINWIELLNDDIAYPKPITVSQTDNVFANLNAATNIDMTVTKNNDIFILLDQYYGGAASEYSPRVNRLYKAPYTNISTLPNAFDVYELPLAIGSLTLVNPLDDKGTLYIVPRKRSNGQPVIKWQNGNIRYIEMASSQSNNVFYREIDIDINWCYHKYNLYNQAYGIVMPLNEVVEHKLPLSYKVSSDTKSFVNFSTYKNFIYTIHSEKVENETTYYLDKIDSTTLEIISSKVVTRSQSITQENFEIPLAASVMSINLEGTKLLVAGGLKANGEDNENIYSIEVETAIIDLLFSDYNIGVYSPYYESESDNAIYVFPHGSHNMVILPYDGSANPVIIPYDESVNIDYVLLHVEENKLAVMGRENIDSPYILFNIDLFTGEISNFTNSAITNPVVAVSNNRSYALVYVQNNENLSDVYRYSKKEHALSLIESGLESKTLKGKFKLDGAYERNNLIGMDLANTGSYEASFYQFTVVHPEPKRIGNEGNPFILGNQIKAGPQYNIESPLVLTELYEYFDIGKTVIRFNKPNNRLELFDNRLRIDCTQLLWASGFYDDILLCVSHLDKSIVYYIDTEIKDIAFSSDVTSNPLLNNRKTNEILFVYNKKLPDNDTVKMGSLYLVGGESRDYIFQDINEITLNVVSSTMSVISTPILPENGTIGAYKGKVLALSNRQATVLYGVTYKVNGIDTVAARIAKSDLKNHIKCEFEKVHYITPDPEYISYYIMTRDVGLINQMIYTSPAKGEIKEAFITGGHVYFVNKKHRYAAEINQVKQLSDLKEFTEKDIDGKIILSDWTNIDDSLYYSKEINGFETKVAHDNGSSYFNNFFKYYLNEVACESKYNSLIKHIIEIPDVDGKIYKEEVEPDSLSILGIIEPSVKQQEGYDFDILFEKKYHNITYIDDDIPVVVNKATIISRVPCTPYRMDIDGALTYGKYQDYGENKDMAFVYNEASHELMRDDYSLYTDTWQVCISNGDMDDKEIQIVLERNGSEKDVYSIKGDNDRFPFENDIVPLVLTYGEMPNDEIGYRYLIFMDIEGNVVTFDKHTKDFISVDGYEEVKIPYLSGELTIFPSKITRQGSIGKRVWGYSEQNPYILNTAEDRVSLTDNSLV